MKKTMEKEISKSSLTMVWVIQLKWNEDRKIKQFKIYIAWSFWDSFTFISLVLWDDDDVLNKRKQVDSLVSAEATKPMQTHSISGKGHVITALSDMGL